MAPVRREVRHLAQLAGANGVQGLRKLVAPAGYAAMRASARQELKPLLTARCKHSRLLVWTAPDGIDVPE